MNTQLLIWLCVAAVAAVLMVIRIASLCHGATNAAAKHGNHRFRLLEVGKEWEEFYVPGDIRYKGDDEDDLYNDNYTPDRTL